MSSKLTQDVDETASGFKNIIFSTLKGIAVSFVLLLAGRFIDIAFGHSWRSSTIVLVITVALAVIGAFGMFSTFSRHSIFYVFGWWIGVYISAKFDLIGPNMLVIFIVSPIVIYLIKIIFKKH